MCIRCHGLALTIIKSYETERNGKRKLYCCDDCYHVFSDTANTFMAGIRKPIDFVIRVLTARTEGLSFNATCRTFSISKHTLLDWEKKIKPIKNTLMIYSLSKKFITQIIEGDEAYTKVYKNVPPEESEGWTITLMERASRFIWEMACGKKDEKLFLIAIKQLLLVIQQTQDITLLTDGERRYGNFLFDLCAEVIKSELPGRPKKTLPQGIKVRLKNKGSQSHKRGPKKKKYVSPKPEHPETTQNITSNDIHANHLEATHSSLRRRDSTYRRKTNTYAKHKSGLQRTLDLFWVNHNFIKEHFTTEKVPAVAMNILERPITWNDV